MKHRIAVAGVVFVGSVFVLTAGPIPGSPAGAAGNVLGAPLFVDASNLDTPNPLGKFVGDIVVNFGDVVLCEKGLNAEGKCVDDNISDVLRFFGSDAFPKLATSYQLFSDPDDEGPLDVTKLPGGKLLAETVYIPEVLTTKTIGSVTVGVIVFDAAAGARTNTYWILSDVEAPEPGTGWVAAALLAGFLWRRARHG